MTSEADAYLPFSVREGIQPRKAIQWRSTDDALRTALWNVSNIFFWQHLPYHMGARRNSDSQIEIRSRLVFEECWMFFFDWAKDDIPSISERALPLLRKAYSELAWFRVYDFFEFLCTLNDSLLDVDLFRRVCNTILERHASAYRFVGRHMTPITSEAEISEVESAASWTSSGPMNLVTLHLNAALSLMAHRESPDYRNSAKESISAVEALCKALAGTPKGDLGVALSALMTRKQLPLHSQFRQALANLYSFTNDAEGIRHALKDEPTLDVEDARFMLVTCSAFINYLLVKADKAGISLRPPMQET